MLKNYTSQIPAKQSIAHIEAKLIMSGAKQILKEYDSEKRLSGISFIIEINGKDLPFKLPARVNECEKVLRANLSPRARPETIKAIPNQAERTAWKILLDWIEAQMAMIELSQIEFTQVFFSYLYDPAQDKTLYAIAKEQGFQKQLTM